MIFSILATCYLTFCWYLKGKRILQLILGIKALHLYNQNIDSPCQNSEFALVVSHLSDSSQYYENCKDLYLKLTSDWHTHHCLDKTCFNFNTKL